MWNHVRVRKVYGSVLAVKKAAVGVHCLDLVPCLEADLCVVQSVGLAVRVYFENFEALEGAFHLLSVDVGDAVWCARISEKITPVGVAVLVDALDAQIVYPVVVKLNEKLLRTIAARAGGVW